MKQPCDEATIRSGPFAVRGKTDSGPWILAATVLGSSMAFIDGTVANVALPALQSTLHATAVDMQWVVESYGLFLSALILVGGAIGDSVGRRLIFLLGAGLFAVASIGCGCRRVLPSWLSHDVCRELALRLLSRAASPLSVRPSTKTLAVKRSEPGRALPPSPQLLAR